MKDVTNDLNMMEKMPEKFEQIANLLETKCFSDMSDLNVYRVDEHFNWEIAGVVGRSPLTGDMDADYVDVSVFFDNKTELLAITVRDKIGAVCSSDDIENAMTRISELVNQ